MEVKGIAVVTLPQYVKGKFPSRYNEWFNALSEESKYIMKNPLAAQWYLMDHALIEPTRKICDIFHGGSLIGAYDCGVFSADYSLKGIYKVFVKIGSPSFIIKKAGRILPTYYNPSEMELVKLESDHADLRISEFENWNPYIAERIRGWITRAIEISGGKSVDVQVMESKESGRTIRNIKINWK